MGRKPCCEKVGLKKGPWTIEEDHKLTSFILSHGIHCWRLVPKLAGLLRCGKSCRLRWVNYLRPDLKRGAFSEAEEDEIIRLHARFGNRWSKIAANFPGRTDNEIKNHWNTRIKKKLKILDLDPHTHKPIDYRHDGQEPGISYEADDSSKGSCSSTQTSNNDNGILMQGWEMEVEEDILFGIDHPAAETHSDQQLSSANTTEDDLQQWISQLESVLFSDDQQSCIQTANDSLEGLLNE